MKMTAMILKYGFTFVMVTINRRFGNHTLTSMAASVVVYVDPTLSRLIFYPTTSFDAKLTFRIEHAFKQRLGCKDPFPRALDFGLTICTTFSMAQKMTYDFVNLASQ